MKYLANSKQRQPLMSHLLGVAKRSEQILSEMNLDKKIYQELSEPLKLAALLHDIGKYPVNFRNIYLKIPKPMN